MVFIFFSVYETELSYQAIFLHDQKSQDENLNILKTKRAFKLKGESFNCNFTSTYNIQKIL